MNNSDRARGDRLFLETMGSRVRGVIADSAKQHLFLLPLPRATVAMSGQLDVGSGVFVLGIVKGLKQRDLCSHRTDNGREKHSFLK